MESNPTPETEETELAGEEVQDISYTVMDAKKQVKADTDLYEQPDAESGKIGAAKAGDIVHVISKADDRDWYGIEGVNGSIEFIEGINLTDIEVEKPKQEQPKQEQPKQEQPKQEQPKQEQTQQPPVQEQPQPEQTEHDRPYDPATGREWEVGDDMGDGGIYLGGWDDIDLSDWGN